MAYIGLLSDTHCVFERALRQFLEPVDRIWHAGDFGNLETADAVAAFRPLTGVHGNCDDQRVRLAHPPVQVFETEGRKVLMMHIGGYPGRYSWQALQLIEAHRPDIFVCGHSHILKVVHDKKRDMLVLNPGAAGVQGFHQVRTALRFRIEDGNIFDMEVGEWERKLQQ